MKALFANRPRTWIIVPAILVGFSIARAQSGAAVGGVIPSQPNDLAVISTAVPGGPGHVSLDGLDFRPFTPTDNTFGYYGASIRNLGASPDWFMATVQIPNGSTINKVVVYYTDSELTAGMDLQVDLMYAPLDTANGFMMGSFKSTGSASGPQVGQITTFINPVVNTAANTYLVQAYLPNSANVSLHGVRVDYAYQAILPAVIK
jgi:hypothetical protein